MKLKYLFILTIFSTHLFADDHSISVLDFSGDGVAERELKTLSEIFRVELLKQDTLRVMDLTDMAHVLSNAGYGDPICTTIECAVISSMLLGTEWMATIHIAKIGDVFMAEARLYESETGRVINVVNYDHELSMEGLKTRGMHNLAEMLMSTRIPMPVHKGQNHVYLKTKPAGAMVRVGRDTLNGVTPMSIDRVVAESRPIIILKKGFEPYRLKHLPEDESDIIYIELQHLVPQIGDVTFKDPVPEGIVIVSTDGELRFRIEEGALDYNKLDAGSYHLESGKYIVHNGKFRIRHRKTSHVNPRFHDIKLIEKDRDKFKLKRNFLIGSLVLTGGYLGYLQYESEQIYIKYNSDVLDGDAYHRQIEKLDQMKPIMGGISVFTIFPIIYHHGKYLQMNRWLQAR
ncbi:MAG: hypothetical protein ISR89_07650 [Candidatus Marinimicrobia bacterium]|nr:hypothetical protein [Candidatus Neomarinimicrobiota bacterium]